MKFNTFSDRTFLIVLIIFFSATIALNISIKGEQQYSHLALSFLQGKLHFLDIPGSLGDVTPYDGKYYWPNPPFPAILILPFAYTFQQFNHFFYQGYLQIPLILLVFSLVSRISSSLSYSKHDSKYLAFAFVFSSVFIGVALWPWSWFLAHTITTVLILLSLYVYQKNKNYLQIGIFYAAILATRFSAIVGLSFFGLQILFSSKTLNNKIIDLFKIISPVLISFILLVLYNYARYGTYYEIGYESNLLPDFHEKARSYGIFSILHIPANLYYLFLSTPLPVFKDAISHVLAFPYLKANPWGLSLFITSPYILTLLKGTYSSKFSRILVISTILISIPIITYFGIGFRQFGYRYSLDFFPFVFFLFAHEYIQKNKHLSSGIKKLFVVGAAFNLYLLLTLFSQA